MLILFMLFISILYLEVDESWIQVLVFVLLIFGNFQSYMYVRNKSIVLFNNSVIPVVVTDIVQFEFVVCLCLFDSVHHLS